MQIEFSSIEQAKAVRDVLRHRIDAVSNDISTLPDPEIDETMALVAFHHRLEALIDHEGEE